MKKSILLILPFFALIFAAKSQPVANGSFENWNTNVYYEEPNFGMTTNLQSYFLIQQGNVEKSTESFSGNYAAKFSTVSNGIDTIQGALFVGSPNSSTINGGIPINVRPLNFVFDAKYSIQPNDTARLFVAFKKSGFPGALGLVIVSLTGTQSTYQTLSTPIIWLDPILVPDTMVAFISSSNFDYPSIPGSELFVDNINFTGAVGAPSTDFESWNAIESEEPDNWSTPNFVLLNQTPCVTKSTDAFDGQFAMKIETIVSTYADTLGFATNGYFASPFAGGMAVTQNPQLITGYYKYNSVGPDTALVGVFVTKYDPILGQTVRLDSMLIYLLPTNSYQPFIVPLFYNSFPLADTLNITFASSNFENNNNFVGIGSVLLVDNIEVAYNSVSSGAFESTKTLDVFPNPANNKLVVNGKYLNSQGHFKLFDCKGSLVLEKSLTNFVNGNSIDLSDVSDGIYIYQINSALENKNGKIVVKH
jgi:hypothetical protein